MIHVHKPDPDSGFEIAQPDGNIGTPAIVLSCECGKASAVVLVGPEDWD